MTEIVKTLEILCDEVIARLRPKYDLIYVDRGDRFSDEQVAAIVAEDWDLLWESAWEWESDQKREASGQIADEVAGEVIADWENEARESGYEDADFSVILDEFSLSVERDEVICAIEERESGGWVRDLARGSGQALLRLPSGVEFELDSDEVAPEDLLTALHLPLTPKNIESAGELLAEAGSGYKQAHILFAASVLDILDLKGETLIVHDPHVFLTNPYAGDGWEVQFDGAVELNRSDLRTDEDAPGYGWNEIAGVVVSAYRCEISDVVKEVAA